jgi:hypothetical protein
MRYIPSNCLRPGQKLAMDLKFNDNRIFLRNEVILTDKLIGRIRSIGFQGLYIDDDISKDLTVANIVSDELMYKAKTEIKSLFLVAEKPSAANFLIATSRRRFLVIFFCFCLWVSAIGIISVSLTNDSLSMKSL